MGISESTMKTAKTTVWNRRCPRLSVARRNGRWLPIKLSLDDWCDAPDTTESVRLDALCCVCARRGFGKQENERERERERRMNKRKSNGLGTRHGKSRFAAASRPRSWRRNISIEPNLQVHSLCTANGSLSFSFSFYSPTRICAFFFVLSPVLIALPHKNTNVAERGLR